MVKVLDADEISKRYSIGEQLRRLLQLVNRSSAARMRRRLEYLFYCG